MKRKLKIGISQGDINSISYEVILKALTDPHLTKICTPIIYGSAKAAAFHKKGLGIESYTISVAHSADDANINKINLINTSTEEPKVEYGHISQEAGEQAFVALEAATKDLINHKIDALVTGPINKSTIQNEKFNFPGHTEYLASKAKGEPLMILAENNLRVALVTTHMPISEVPNHITTENILAKIKQLNASLIKDFNIIRPRIAVLSLNPHAGDNGLLGKEENDIIKPAIDKAIEGGIVCVGPLAADGLFGSGNYKHFDAVLAMYHDQGLAPFKALSSSYGVNITAGLNVVRTSPAHGTGYDIAGQNVACELSMREAMYKAIEIVYNREEYAELTKNPLPYPKHEQTRPYNGNRFNPDKEADETINQ